MYSAGIGGGGFMLYKLNDTTNIIDFREEAPGAAHRDMYHDNPYSSELGVLSIGVPGELKGLWKAHQINGKLSWKRLIMSLGFILGHPFN
jgi:gamma-glutamyltranspeptidase